MQPYQRKINELKVFWCNLSAQIKLLLLMYTIAEIEGNPEKIFTREEIDKIKTMIDTLDKALGCEDDRDKTG